MVEEIKLDPSQIRFEGIFDWPALYSHMFTWLRGRKFDYYEKKHVVKKPGTFGYETEFIVQAEREESPYLRLDIKMEIKGFQTEDVEVIENGVKKQKTKVGMIYINLQPVLVLDWTKKWEGKVEKKAHTFFTKYIIRKQIEEWKEQLHYETYKFQTMIKKELGLEHKYSAYE